MSTDMINASTWQPTTDKVDKVLGSIYAVITSAVLVANLIVLVVIIKAKELRKLSLWFIANMAFWDLLQGLNFLVFAVPSAFLGRFAYPRSMLGFSACLSTFLLGTTLLSTLAIVTDRFISIKFPLIYRTIANKRAFVITVFCIITIAAIRMILVAFPDMDFYFAVEIYLAVSNFNTVQGLAASTGFMAMAVGTVIVLSCIVIHTIRKRKQRISPSDSDVQFVPQKMLKLSVMVVLSAMVYCLSYAPALIGFAVNFMLGKNMSPLFAKVANVTLMTNSIWNLLIYTLNYNDFREALIRIFCKSYYLDRKRRRQIVPFVRAGNRSTAARTGTTGV